MNLLMLTLLEAPEKNLILMLRAMVHARNPNFSPFFFANLINPCLCFASAPIDLQNSPITYHVQQQAVPSDSVHVHPKNKNLGYHHDRNPIFLSKL